VRRGESLDDKVLAQEKKGGDATEGQGHKAHAESVKSKRGVKKGKKIMEGLVRYQSSK